LFAILITAHVLICFGLIISVLMQSAKGEGLAGAMGGGGGISGAVFGGRGAAPFLSKATTVLAIMFMGMCVLLTLTTGGGRSGAAVAGASGVQEAAQRGAQERQATTPADVPAVNVGQQGEQQEELPVRIVPSEGGKPLTEPGTQTQPATQQDQQTDEKKQEQPSGGQ
jgi:preprotein translocase subunit SecG